MTGLAVRGASPSNFAPAGTPKAALDSFAAALGKALVAEFAALKSAEWNEYSQHVSAWETKRYLDRF